MMTSFAELIQQAKTDVLPVAVLVWPVTAGSLQSAIEAQTRGIAACTLVGDVDAMRTLAGRQEIDLDPLVLVDEPDYEQALGQAMHLCHQRQAAVLVNEGIPFHRLLAAVADAEGGLGAGKTINGVSVLDWGQAKRLLLLTDGHVIVSPDLEQRVALIENAIWVANRLGIERPHVALIAAAETVNPKSQVSIDAAQITVMARRQQIKGALIDGPLGFDNAVSVHAAEVKGIQSEVAGRADVLVAPDMEAGSLLLKTMSSLCQMPAASVIVGGRTPVVLWSPSDPVPSRVAGLALGLVCSRH